jgi:hypothetical protein
MPACEAGVADMALHKEGDAGVGEPVIGDLAVLSDRPEDLGEGDLRIVEPGPQYYDGAGVRLASVRDAPLDSFGGLVGLRPTQG